MHPIPLGTLISLFGAMFALAVLPSPSVFAVVARSLSAGLRHGVLTAVGIMVGDFVFILVAILGLAAIADTITPLFEGMKYVGAAYLLWLGIRLWRVKEETVTVTRDTLTTSLGSSFACGLLITLGDPKAIIFYVSFFPAFVDVSQLTWLDTGLLLGTTAIAVGGTKIAYAYLADKARVLFQRPKAKQLLNRVAAVIMMGTALLIFR